MAAEEPGCELAAARAALGEFFARVWPGPDEARTPPCGEESPCGEEFALLEQRYRRAQEECAQARFG